ncbi:hypothetical protein RBU61_04735 [Tissierella sp. MB52-C2]|uniref:hypothetical protein n=1 Tax=Tissierella sp. MB52-C2 TaxID=3070999 RepID=UPI00280B6971|nr:hypothetical protein [Tissierella sp. MB52-C2]WMM25983.1 hypothetical protein RBU61_04735 [Tissierella sp. MB52-C2]
MMLNSKKVKMLSIILLFACIFSSSILANADSFNNNLDENGIPIGEYKALDINGNVIEDVDSYIMRRDSGWMYTTKSSTYSLKDGNAVIGYFNSRARYRVSFSNSVTDWSDYGSSAWPRGSEDDGCWADVRIDGSYKPNDYTARLTITGEAGDILLGTYGAVSHVYWFYGNGTWDMQSF